MPGIHARLLACLVLLGASCGASVPAFPSALALSLPTAITPGAADSWDGKAVHAPSVVDTPSGYLLWYDGTSGPDPYAGWAIGLATSQDGLKWQKSPENPVLRAGPPGSWDGASVHDPRVIWDGRRFLMWYSGYDGTSWRVGLAYSEDGVRWTKHGGNPVLEPGPKGSWDDASVAYSSVVWKDTQYHMWYQGGDRAGRWRIGYALSEDGLRWQKSAQNPVLMPGPHGAWDAERVFTPHVVLWHKGYLMLYTGGLGSGIGYAFSPDGVRWRKALGNPALSPRAGSQVLTVAALQRSNVLAVWYAEGGATALTIKGARAHGAGKGP